MAKNAHPQMLVDHVSVAVDDIDRALGFFRACFPIEMNVEKRVGYSDDFNWCDFYIGNFKIELIDATRADSFVRRFIDKRGEGIHHLSLETTDLATVLERLERDSLRIVDRFRGENGDYTAFISPRSAHGMLVQFWQTSELIRPERPQTGTLRLRSGEMVTMCIDHLAVAVHDIDTTYDTFLHRYFPIQLRHEKHTGYDGTFVLLSFWLNGYKMELIQQSPEHVPGFVTRFLERRGEGFHHISVDVDRLDPLLAQLKADGVRIVGEADMGLGFKTAFISPRSAHGVLIQFWQLPSLGEHS